MNNSSKKPIIAHISDFLEYYENKKYSQGTIVTYTRLLDKFEIWLKKTSRTRLLPNKLSQEIINEYKAYLSKQNLSNNTQNLYLIGLRNLLAYFLEKDIPSLHPKKVKLLKHEGSSHRTIEKLELYQIKKLLQAPKTSTITGLRDRALLELLLATGLKLKNLIALNRDEIKIESDNNRLELKIPDKKFSYSTIVYLPKNAVNWLKKYLQKRNDKSRALFIRYKGPKQASSRLTARSVENIVKKYVIKANLSLSLTPENLRNAYVLILLNQENDIKITGKLSHHKDLVVNTYKFITTNKFITTKDSNKDRTRPQLLPWNIVETSINKEITWLKDNISILPESYKQKHLLINCDECLLRKLAILITSGKVETTRFKAKKGKDLWSGLTKQKKIQKISKHGEEWHRRMIDVISHYFRLQHYKTLTEPILNYGRADLGVYSNSKNPLYIEVGTVSLYKLWYNFLTMKNSYFLLVPSEEYAIEFKI
ncbi:tyrosine-type recombinase/integrase [bacterium]|nr:tyrosine-type recombinase/integrase [bacterium]